MVNNAVKFTERGQVTVLVTNRSADLPAAEILGPNEYAVIIADTGPGIPASAREQMFCAFTQADASTTRRYGGTGLGLAITRQLAELMGGRTGFCSTEGEGATFWIVLPCHLGVAQVRRSVEDLLAGKKAFVLHPVALAREHIAAGLVSLGCAPEGAADLPADIDRFDLLLVDDSLWRQLPPRRTLQLRVRLVALSGRTSDQERGGADGLLSKPVQHKELRSLLARLLRGNEAPPASLPAPTVSERNLRVLVVEDNKVNRLLAETMLRKAGCVVECAEDGAEGVAAVKNNGVFDLVFMDCQMPVMDGYEATAAIRAWEAEQPERRPLPIIALTANALAGDRELCLAAGMTDYLTKPVKRDQLATVLQLYAGDAAAPDATPVPPGSAAAGDN